MQYPKIISLAFLLLSACRFSGENENPAAQDSTETPSEYLYQLPQLTNWPASRPLNESLAEDAMSKLLRYQGLQVLVVQNGSAILWYGVDDTLCLKANNPIILSTLAALRFTADADIPELLKDNSLPDTQQLIDYAEFEEQYAKILQMPVSLYAELNLFEPLAIDTYSWKDSLFCSSLPEFAKLARVWTNGGKFAGEQIVSREGLEQEWSYVYQPAHHGKQYHGWTLFYNTIKGRRQPVMFWQSGSLYLYFYPELDAMIFIAAPSANAADLWKIVQENLAASLLPG